MSHPFGNLFPEMLTRGATRLNHRQVEEDGSVSHGTRFFFFVAVLVLGIGLLLVRLLTLTVIEGARFHKLAQNNRIRENKIPAPRGIIYDRGGTALVRNIPGYSVTSVTSSLGVADKVDREYVFGDLFSHVLGYTGEISEEELKSRNSDLAKKSKRKDLTYKPGDIVGKMGIEESYDAKLRGIDGKELVEVDAMGNKMRVLGRVEPIVGQNLTLSVDADLQKIAKDELAGKKGAIVATNPTTGEVLALYSSPSFDPNKFISGTDIDGIFSDPDQPLFNRAISGTYPPGSTFKIAVALAALSEGVITKDSAIEDTGILSVGDYSFANWYFTQYGKKEGMVDVVNAIRRSNDIFFYKTGELLEINKLASFAKKLGLNNLLGIDITGEEKGVMPDPDWLSATRGEKWYLGNTYHVAIGQGDLLTTPLQVNALTNVVADGGKLCTPHLSKLNRSETLCKNLDIKKEAIDLVREGMKQACSPGGTGWPLFKFKVKSEKLKVDNVDFLEPAEASGSGKNWVEIPTVCKTGTAELGDTYGRTHAWFTVFAPIFHPQISVTVLVEGGGEGSSVAGPIAKKILEEWFGGKK